MLERCVTWSLISCCILAGIIPLCLSLDRSFAFSQTEQLFASPNFIGWCGLSVLVALRQRMATELRRTMRELGITTRATSLESFLQRAATDLLKIRRATSSRAMDESICSNDALSRTLEHIVGQAFTLLGAESAELSLVNQETGMYQAALVLGAPIQSGSQAMLSGSIDGSDTKKEKRESDRVLTAPISFAGTTLGTLRVGMPRGYTATESNPLILKALSQQCMVALLNKRYNEVLLRMKQSSDESVKAKTGFLANLSHEIRGPLGIIMNAIEIVLDGLCGEITEDQRSMLSMVLGNGTHLLELINDVLDYAKIEAGKVKPAPVTILAGEFVPEMVKVVQQQADTKKHRVSVRDGSFDGGLLCDRRHARQMMINLLTNAIKYTPDGGQIEVWADGDTAGWVRLNVKDSGVGIEPAQRSRVFAPFERTDDQYALKQVGTGLGMPLTRRLAEMNGGKIDFTSIPGQGSHFWIDLPPAPAVSETAVDEVKEEARGNGQEILILAPADGVRQMVERYLNNRGFHAVTVENEGEAQELVAARNFDLCILDNFTIDGSPERSVDSLRMHSKNSKVPIVLLSSRGFDFDIEKYLRIGIDRCLVKPVELRELGLTCSTILGGDSPPHEAKNLLTAAINVSVPPSES